MTTDGREMTQRDSVEPFEPGKTDPTFVAPVVPDDAVAPDAPIPPPLPQQPQRPNFCSTCGSPWDPALDRCAACDARIATVWDGAVLAAPVRRSRTDNRAPRAINARAAIA